MRARGAVGVSMSWSGGKLKSATLNYSPSALSAAKKFTIRTSVPVKVKGAGAKARKDGAYYLTTLTLKPGVNYVLTAR